MILESEISKEANVKISEVWEFPYKSDTKMHFQGQLHHFQNS